MTVSIFSDVRRWLFADALPFWAERGIDRTHGGYVEQLNLDGTDAGAAFKRTRVIGRQMYAFSHSALLGRPGDLALARQGFAYLTQKAWLGPDRGWARRLDRNGDVIDATADLYDIAFVLFGLGWYHRASGDPAALAWALRTLDFVDKHMRHPGGVGFLHEKPATGPRLQNPHMHLLEAALINLETSGHPRFRALADEVVDLFAEHLFDPVTQTLAEYFEDDWTRQAGERGRITEPGHQLEWAWILAGYQRATGQPVGRLVRGLVEFAERHGISADGMAFSAVRDDGVVLDAGSRTWCTCERIQAAVAMFELFGEDPRPIFESSGRLLLQRFLSHTPRGTWIDQVAADGTPCTDKVPASTLYHVMIAFAEMLRVEGAVTKAFAGEDIVYLNRSAALTRRADTAEVQPELAQ